jgi:NitT/TauT family transport system substrate-binding protein
VILSRDLYDRDPAKAAAITRAWIRGARWVGENPEAAAELGVSAGIWDGDADSLRKEIDRYMWMPGVAHAKEHLKSYVHEWKGRGLLPKDTDEEEFFGKLFIQALPDVS